LKIVSISSILEAIADDKSLSLFNAIVLNPGNADVLINGAKLTRREFYSRIHKFRNTGLIRKIDRNYRLTSFGLVVYQAQKLMLKGIEELPELDVIDSIELGAAPPADERKRLIDIIIKIKEIKDILHNHSP
jgi:hypothetical protein